MIKEFKEFMLRGSVLDLAIGVVIGGAFTAIVSGVVDGLITPLIGLLFKAIFNMSETQMEKGLVVNLGGANFKFGMVITAIISFVITAFVLFMIMKGMNKLRAATGKGDEEEEEIILTAEDYLREIRDLLEEQSNNSELAEKAKADLADFKSSKDQ